MFNFEKEVVINSNVLDSGQKRFMALTGKVVLEDGTFSDSRIPDSPTFRVLRCADYKKKNLVNGLVYKTTGTIGIKATALFAVPTVVGKYQVELRLQLIDDVASDYANTTTWFSKMVFAEFDITGNAVVDQKVMLKLMKESVPENYRYLTFKASGSDKILVSCTDSHQKVILAEIQSVKSNASIIYPNDSLVHYSNAVVTDNKVAFATGTWLTENLRFPTSANRVYMGITSDETPVIGQLYNQYSWANRVINSSIGGLSAVGQELVSITGTTFYVLQSLAAEFEQELKEAFGPDSIVDPSVPVTHTVTVLYADTAGTTIPVAQFASQDGVVMVAHVDNVSVPAETVQWQSSNPNYLLELSLASNGSQSCKLIPALGYTVVKDDVVEVIAYKDQSAGKKKFTVVA